jgi:hypothetical protein
MKATCVQCDPLCLPCHQGLWRGLCAVNCRAALGRHPHRDAPDQRRVQFQGGLGRLKKSKFGPILYHDVIFGDASYRIMDFNALEGWVSFHHLLHWLLGGAVLACGSVAR